MAPPTILTHKSAFLTAQTLHLSQTLNPSPAWRASNDGSEHMLSDKAVDEALYRLNHALRQHAQRVYALQATRNVAEQIEGLFLNTEDPIPRDSDAEDDDVSGYRLDGGDVGEKGLREGIDLTTDPSIAGLPPTWATHRPSEAEAHPVEARRYTDLQAQLISLSGRRAATKARVERLRHMDGLLAPFQAGVQENLVTRNGEVEQELERMRVLLIRVAGRVEQLPGTEMMEGEPTEIDDLEEMERTKVASLLHRF
ncbi:kinetochore Sim4 complex subunit Fta4 [Pseudomassariella vexata]|uniref:Kinetochore Sim4 complex subunit Fta4 n=1 Tax=Pseudomassariella vexata TaxID=1141098 RepID=A0A1Y2DAM3_9PEZI|nr:kinetochore Sim4 complex subunit Fta4 [Pseudomassariella vexata]ORY56322.1 kinetochore Sim4 complex subunit Fta4 [Pseudomassariella vexata]